jgi:hypothetical protein
MRKFIVLCLTVAVLWGGSNAQAADTKKAKAISEYCHVCEAASRVSLEFVVMLAKHPYERALAAYAAKIADTNTEVFRRLKAPPGAGKIKEHFGKAVAAFERAVKLHRKGEYKASDKAGKECRKEFWAAVAEVKKLRRDGVIP